MNGAPEVSALFCVWATRRHWKRLGVSVCDVWFCSMNHRGEAASAVVSWRGVGTARRLKLAILAGVEFGSIWRVPRDFGCRGSLVAEPEDEHAGLDLFGREKSEAAGLAAELHL